MLEASAPYRGIIKPPVELVVHDLGEDFFDIFSGVINSSFSRNFFYLEELLADGTHSRSSKFSEFADCFSRNKRSFLYVGIYYLTKIFFALLALDFVILEPDLSNATIL